MERDTLIYKLLTLLLFILCLCLVPIFLILSSPIFVFRFLVAKLAKHLKPDLGKMMSTRGSAMSGDGVYNRPLTNITSVYTLEGNVDFETARELIKHRLENSRLPNGDLKYPELKQFLVTWAGFLFFKEDPDFDFKNHIKLHERCKSEEHFNQTDIEDFRRELLNKGWDEKRPLWDITFVNNCFPKDVQDAGPHTLLISRLHHSLADGFSWWHMLVKEVCQSQISFPKPAPLEPNRCSDILSAILFPFRAAYEFAAICMTGFETLPFRAVKQQDGTLHTEMTQRIGLKKLKKIRANFQVSFSAVVYAAIGGAVREFLISNNVRVPLTLPALTPQPVLLRTEKLRNHVTGLVIEFPTGESDPVRRLKLSHSNLESQKKSTVPRTFEFLLPLMGSYFNCMTKILAQNFAITTGFSNFPSGNQVVSFNDGVEHKRVDYAFAVGPQRGSCGLVFCGVSHLDEFRICLVGDSSVVSKPDLTQLRDLIEKEVDLLYHQVQTNDV